MLILQKCQPPDFFGFPRLTSFEAYPKYHATLLVPEEEIKAAEEKFEESKEVCYNSMLNLIESSDVSDCIHIP